jgi:glycosyltransferase involved in cell wall biosynthesis
VVNQRLDACQRLWIHDDLVALNKINCLDPKIKVVVGPNLYVLEREIPAVLNLSKVVYLHPCLWSKELWLESGFNRCPIEIWPVGIDTDYFYDSAQKKNIVLVYFKKRTKDELLAIENLLKSKNIEYVIIKYGKYKENKYREILFRSRYVIWLGGSESQGIAMLEALSSNVPVLVYDIKSSNKIIITSAPYFSDQCGLKINDSNKISEAVDFMEKSLSLFKPREFILKNFELNKKAKDFIEIYDRYFGLSFQSGLSEKTLLAGNWRNNKLNYILFIRLKEFVKAIIGR